MKNEPTGNENGILTFDIPAQECIATPNPDLVNGKMETVKRDENTGSESGTLTFDMTFKECLA